MPASARDQRRLAGEVLSRPDRIAAVADRLERRSAPACRAWRARTRGDALLPRRSRSVPARRSRWMAWPRRRRMPRSTQIADRLWTARGRGLVISGSQDVRVQALCNFINQTIGAYGTTRRCWRGRRTSAPAATRSSPSCGRSSGAARWGRCSCSAPTRSYDLPGFGEALANDIKRVPLVVSTAERLDETASLAHFVCPDHHYLESWSDAEPVAGLVSLTQPTIQPMHDTRSADRKPVGVGRQTAVGAEPGSRHWTAAIHPTRRDADSERAFWDRTLERGVAGVRTAAGAPAAARSARDASIEPHPRSTRRRRRRSSRPDDRPASGVRAGAVPEHRHARRPARAQRLAARAAGSGHEGHLGQLRVAVAGGRRAARRRGRRCRSGRRGWRRGAAIELPAFVQPGQHDAVVAIALGYGRAGTDRFAQDRAAVVRGARATGHGRRQRRGVRHGDGRRPSVLGPRGDRVTKTGGRHQLASTQVHHSLDPPGRRSAAEPRPIVQETTLGELTGTCGGCRRERAREATAAGRSLARRSSGHRAPLGHGRST